MKIIAFLATVAVCLATAETESIPYNQVFLLPEPKPKTPSEITGVKFKPQLSVADGICSPYAAVNKDGQASAALPILTNFKVKAHLHAQVYGRGSWHENLWATMYTWYIPTVNGGEFPNVIVWTNNPNVTDQNIEGVSLYDSKNYLSEFPAHSFTFSGTNVLVRYETYRLQRTTLPSKLLNLVMWEQLTDKAREALNDIKNFEGQHVPFSDNNFKANLEKAFKARQL